MYTVDEFASNVIDALAVFGCELVIEMAAAANDR
jgi:hypothetical protein